MPFSSESQVENWYKFNVRENVAFIDETFHLPEDPTKSTPPFYMLTAVVVPVSDFTLMRTEMREISDGRLWHTTKIAYPDEYKGKDPEPSGEQDIIDMVATIASYSSILLSLRTPLKEETGEADRRQSFFFLLKTLTEQGYLHNGDGFLLEQRTSDRSVRNGTLRLNDGYTINELNKKHRAIRIGQTSPEFENLLWAPDAIGWSARNGFLTKEKHMQFITPALPKLKTVRVP